MKKRNKRIVSQAIVFCMVSTMVFGNVPIAQASQFAGTGYETEDPQFSGGGDLEEGNQAETQPEDVLLQESPQKDMTKEEITTGKDAAEEKTPDDSAAKDENKAQDEITEAGEEDAEPVTDEATVPPLDEISTLQTEILSNGINDTWTNSGGINAAANELYGSVWRLIVSSAKNKDSKATGYFTSTEAGTFKDGFFETTIFSGSRPEDTRTGVALRYSADPETKLVKGVFVGYNFEHGWYYQIFDGKENKLEESGKPALPQSGMARLRVEVKGDLMSATLDGQELFKNIDIKAAPEAGQVALKVASYGRQTSTIYFSNIHYTGQKVLIYGDVTGKVVYGNNNEPVTGAAIEIENKIVYSGNDGTFRIPLEDREGNYNLTVKKDGYKTYKSKAFKITNASDIDLGVIKLEKAEIETLEIASDAMKVTVDKHFPRVIEYTMLDEKNNGKKFDGQKAYIDTIAINGATVIPAVTCVSEKNKATYTLSAVDADNNIDVVLTAELVVDKNTLAFNITSIKDNKIVKTIEIKNHNLVSVNSAQTGAVLDGAVMSVNTHKNGDRRVLVNADLNVNDEAKKGYMYAFVSNDDLSAGLWSNSENNVSANWERVTANATEDKGVKTIGLSSTYWTYQKDENHRKEDGTIEYADDSKGSPIVIDELPSAKVAIAGDVNGDGGIDWNDGAIAYRDIMNNPNGAEKVPDLVAYRIAMNFGGHAQNPFLMTLDNLKKISLHTDALGQSILLKGYGSEGHDSGHLNYADIGSRIGGANDMKYLLEQGEKYGATFGIHVNASETYPESKYFSEEILRKDKDGKFLYGWNWLDQGINIDADYDLRHGRVDRWKDLYDVLGGPNNKLDFIYVDVWGNGQSGDNGTWASRQLAKEITGLGWRLAGEWGHANEYDSTFQHWAADLTYGGFNNKGINSTIARFIRNHQKDSWVGNFTKYGGEADAPLLGGYSMKDFEGWQGRSDYAAYIRNLYEVDLASKYVQHFTVSDWEDGENVTMSDNHEAYYYKPGMKAVLDGVAGKLVIERKSNDFANDKNGYRTRTMELNGVKIYEGREGFTEYLIPWLWNANGKKLETGEQKLYYWNSTESVSDWTTTPDWYGKNVTVYELTDLGKKEVGKLTVGADGKIDLKSLALAKNTPYVIYMDTTPDPVEDMTWSEGMHIVDSGFNSGSLKPWSILDATEGNGVAIAKSQGSNPMLAFTNTDKTVSVSQKLTDLKPNTKYTAYVGVDNRSDAIAELKVSADGTKTTASAGRSVALNFVSAYAHNTKKSVATVNDKSFFQNMFVFFETGNDVSNVTLTISREKGAGATYFDDIRVCENKSQNWEKWDSEKVFTQNFEDVAQGIYPFVVGALEGNNRENSVTDNRTHLAEKHAPFTQRGWNHKVVNDVIEGNWSLKTNGLAQYQELVYQTIPQNFTFEAGKCYVVSFDYEAGGYDTYAFVTGSGEVDKNKANIIDMVKLDSTASEDVNGKSGHFMYSFVAPEDTNSSWIGIYSTDVAPNLQGYGGSQATFNGYRDFMLDNLVIKESASNRVKLYNAVSKAEEYLEEIYTKDSWRTLVSALTEAKKILEETGAAQEKVDNAEAALTKAIEGLKEVKVTRELLQGVVDRCGKYTKDIYSPDGWLEFSVTRNYAVSVLEDLANKRASQESLQTSYKDLIFGEHKLIRDTGEGMEANPNAISTSKFEIEAGSYQPGISGEGDPKYAIDNDPNTIWHTNHDGSKPEERWFNFNFKEPQEVSGMLYLPRQGGGNGEIYDYSMQISKDNGKTYLEVDFGTWDYDNDGYGWRTIELDGLISGVTNVRLKAERAKNDFASAAEIQVLGRIRGEQAAPAGLKTEIATKGKADGKITGVTTAMEFSTSVDGEYTTCTGSEITGLAVGNYYVRYALTDTLRKSLPTRVTIYDTFTPVYEGSGSSGSVDVPAATPDEKPLDPSTDGWEAIDKVVSEKTNGTISIEMKEEKVLPSNTLSKVEGKDVILSVEAGEVTWRINGKNVKDTTKDVNLEVTRLDDTKPEVKELDTILQKQAKLVKEDKITQIEQFDVKQDGKLPFRATMKAPVTTDAKKVIISYYDEETGKLELVAYKQVKNQTVTFVPEKGGRYVITDVCPVNPEVKAKTSVKSGNRTKISVANILKGKAKVSYKVNNKSIAAISSKGSLLAKKKGTVKVTITVKQAGKTYKVTKTVKVK